MYLDLSSPTALVLLYKALGMFVTFSDPMLDRADILYSRCVRYTMKDSDIFRELEEQMQTECKQSLSLRGMNPSSRDHDFVQQSLEFDDSAASFAKDERKTPKNNWLAVLRLVRRCTNKIAIQHDLIDFKYGLPHCFRMETKWKEETVFLRNYERDRHKGTRRTCIFWVKYRGLLDKIAQSP
jgi:hypothetical protein